MRFLLSGTSSSPIVFFDLSANFLHIAGVSAMTDAALFYEKLSTWLKHHAVHIRPGTELMLSLHFLNSASIRALYAFLREIAEQRWPLHIVIMHQEQSDNSDVVEVLTEACKLLGLSWEVRKKS
jgi:hypothetical protein